MNYTTVWLERPRHFTDEKRSFSSNTMTALFTVEHNRAKQHHVRIGLQNDREVEIVAPDLHPGDMAVVMGNYELKGGMNVNVLPAGPGSIFSIERPTI